MRVDDDRAKLFEVAELAALFAEPRNWRLNRHSTACSLPRDTMPGVARSSSWNGYQELLRERKISLL